MLKSANPEVKRMLGVEGKFGEGLGLSNTWAVNVLKQIGNYGEVYERNLGSLSPLKIPRGLNKLWSKGGLQYGPPIR
jgi:general L-amino acid transport system substrate-binding protein